MKISIITTTYNSESTIRDTIESVLSQTYKNIEYIIIDGKSADGTIDIIKEYESKFNGRMRWISESDRGIYDAMNKGIALAEGDVIGLLNSDDFYTSNDVLSIIAKEIEGVDAIYGDIHYVSPNNLKKCIRYYSSKNFRIWKMRFGFMPGHPSFYCRPKIYKKYGNFDLNFRTAGDFDILLRFLYLKKIKTKYVNKDFVTMRTGGETSSGFQSYKKSYMDRRRIFRKYGLHYNLFMASILYFSKLKDLLIAKLNF